MTLLVPLVSVLANRALKKRKNYKPSVRGGLLSILVPPVALVLNLLRPSRPAIGRTPEEQEVFNRCFSIDGKKKELDRKLDRRDKLEMFQERSFAYRATHPDQWFSQFRLKNLDKDIRNRKADLRSDYEMLGMMTRKAELSGKERFLSVYMDHNGPGGKSQFVLPYDITREQTEEIKSLLARQYGVNPNDSERFVVGEHRAADRNGYKPGQTVLEFDAVEHVISAFGAELSDSALKKINETNGRLMEVLEDRLGDRKLKDRKSGTPEEDESVEERQGIGIGSKIGKGSRMMADGMLMMEPLGKEAVALSMNGVVLAYAVAGADGKVRAMGNHVSPGDRDGIRFANKLNETLKGCTSIDAWIDKASKIVLSENNVDMAVKSLERRVTARQELRAKKAMRNSILYAPKLDTWKRGRGLKNL